VWSERSDVINSSAVATTPDDLLALYDRTIDEVYRYASRLTAGDPARTDDLVQDTYLSMLRRIQSGKPVDLSVGYVITSCRNRFLDGIKADRRRAKRELRVVTAGGTTGPDLDEVATARLAELPDDQRAALVLRYVDDHSVSEVARQLGRSVAATESLLARARTAMRHLLEEDER
jgi:RNA polymerase sigma-70 factor (ECF subfamily)